MSQQIGKKILSSVARRMVQRRTKPHSSPSLSQTLQDSTESEFHVLTKEEILKEQGLTESFDLPPSYSATDTRDYYNTQAAIAKLRAQFSAGTQPVEIYDEKIERWIRKQYNRSKQPKKPSVPSIKELIKNKQKELNRRIWTQMITDLAPVPLYNPQPIVPDVVYIGDPVGEPEPHEKIPKRFVPDPLPDDPPIELKRETPSCVNTKHEQRLWKRLGIDVPLCSQPSETISAMIKG